METFVNAYLSLFPNVEMRDWFFAFLGLLLHVSMKLKNVRLRDFKWKILLEEFAPVWFFSVVTIIICLGTLPQVLSDYSVLDSAFIGYSSSSIFKQLFKTRMSQLHLTWQKKEK